MRGDLRTDAPAWHEVLEWALACAPHCAFARAWAEEYQACAELGFQTYRRALPAYAFPGKGAVKYAGVYFTMHQAALKLMYEHPEYPVQMRPSKPGPLGDEAGAWACVRALRRCESPPGQQPFYKINGTLRRKIDASLRA